MHAFFCCVSFVLGEYDCPENPRPELIISVFL